MGTQRYRGAPTAASAGVDILLAPVIDFQAAVHVLSGDVVTAALHKIQKRLLPHCSQISGDDAVIIGGTHTEILKILADGIPGRRCHGSTHIHRILGSHIHQLSGGDAGHCHTEAMILSTHSVPTGLCLFHSCL